MLCLSNLGLFLPLRHNRRDCILLVLLLLCSFPRLPHHPDDLSYRHLDRHHLVPLGLLLEFLGLCFVEVAHILPIY